MAQICKHVSVLTVRSAEGNKLHFILRYVYSTITGHINLGTGVDGSWEPGWEIIKYRGWQSFRNNTETKDLQHTILRTQEKCMLMISRCIVQTGTIINAGHHNSTRGDTTTATGHKTHIYNTTLRDLSNERQSTVWTCRGRFERKKIEERERPSGFDSTNGGLGGWGLWSGQAGIYLTHPLFYLLHLPCGRLISIIPHARVTITQSYQHIWNYTNLNRKILPAASSEVKRPYHAIKWQVAD